MVGRGIGRRARKQAFSDSLVDLPFISGLSGKVAGGVAFTRASTQWITDFEGVVRPVMAGCPAIGGARVVTNLLVNSSNPTPVGGNWVQQNTSLIGPVDSSDSSFRLSLGTVVGQGIYGRSVPFTFNASSVLVYSIWLRSDTGTGTVQINDSSGFSTNGVIATVTSEWQRFYLVTSSRNLNATNPGTPGVWIRLTAGGLSSVLAKQPQIEDVTGQSVQTPGEYVPTTSAPLSQCFATKLDGTAVPDVQGILCEPASTNKCTCYGTIPADTLGAEKVVNGGFDTDTVWMKTGTTISGGNLNFNATPGNSTTYQSVGAVGGKVYEITYTIVSISSGAIVAAISGASGVVRTAPGTFTERLIATGSTTNIGIGTSGDATTAVVDNVSCKEVQYAIGTKSFYTGGAWVQNHTNMTLSGDQAAVLSTVDDTAALTAAGLIGIAASGKVYKLDNSAGVAVCTVVVTGATGNTNNHSLSLHARILSGGSCYLTWNGVDQVTLPLNGGVFGRTVMENKPPASSADQLRVTVGAGKVVYFLLPQLEELPFCTSPMPTQGATATRAAGFTKFSSVGNTKLNDFTIYFEATLLNVSVSRYLFQNQLDANNWLIVGNTGATGISAYKNVANISGSSNRPLPLTFGMSVKVCLVVSATSGFCVFVNGVKGAANGNTTNLNLAPFTYVGDSGGGGAAYIKNLRLYRKPLTDALCIAMTT